MVTKNIRILGTGRSLPKQRITNNELEAKLELPAGWIEKHCGMITRYHVTDELASDLGVQAVERCLDKSGIQPHEIDAIIGFSGVPQQAIPCFAATIHKRFGMKKIPAFDVNSTCLSFLTGLSVGADMIESGNFQRILLVSGDIASCGLNPKDPHTATLFGDGAAAVVIGPSNNSSSGFHEIFFETWTESQDACLLEAGGTKLHLKEVPEEEAHRQYFQMDGPKLIKASIPYLEKIIDQMLAASKTSFEEIKVCVPHQASPLALRLFEKRLRKTYGDFKCEILKIVEDYGNMIATSIPFALDYAIEQGKINRNDKIMIVGTSAGISIGGMILEY